MNKINILLIVFLLQISCQNNRNIINDDQDKKQVDHLIRTFFSYEKNKNYDAMFELFTLGNSKITRKELNAQLLKIFEETQYKNGDVIKVLSKSYQTEVKMNGKDTIGMYNASIDNERKFVLSRETFKMMLENGKIKIYDYHIAVKVK